MSLTGNLEIFPMPEVLRLLSRSKKTGCLTVDAVETEGRIYLAGGAITFANTRSDDVFRQALINSGLVTEDSLRSSGASLNEALVDGQEPSAITDFVREYVVESLYRIRKPGHGEFEFAVDVAPAFNTGQQFDAEVAVAESERRAAEWEDILESIDNLDAPIRMVHQLSDDNSVTIAAPTWKVLASLEGGTSVRELAHRTGLSEFRAARELSGLIRSELVTVLDTAVSYDSGYQAPVVERSVPGTAPDFDSFLEAETAADDAPAQFEAASESDVTADSETETSWGTSPWDAPDEPVDETPAESGGGWFEETVGDSATADAIDSDQFSDDEITEPTEEAATSGSDGGWWASAVESGDAPAATATNDTIGGADPDSFLESVFSQLNDDVSDEETSEDDETGFSMGLLRRRRMGAAARDITEG